VSEATGNETPFLLLAPERMGKALLSIAEQAGGIAVLAARLLARLLPPRIERYELIRNFYKMGVRSVGIVSVTALFTGAIMVVQIAPLVVRFSATEIIGWGAGFAMLREVGPLLIALMFSGRVGANNTAELGTMVVTEQLDALRALAIEPLSYLILPRVLSMIVMLFVLTIFGDLVAIAGAILSAKVMLDEGLFARFPVDAFVSRLLEVAGLIGGRRPDGRDMRHELEQAYGPVATDDAGPAERQRMADAFERSCHHEIRFWQMAWTQERWTPPTG
jgi:phospholipid/cholesterol/gamma-HCH transport system permease protein